ncbi:MAG: hypothetical protein U0L99_10395 [Ruminococcus sp.]|nr:hypothetical protein [Ruminococcus sp.]
MFAPPVFVYIKKSGAPSQRRLAGFCSGEAAVFYFVSAARIKIENGVT